MSELDWNQLIETALTVEGSVGNIYNRFYEYSYLNQMFLMMQGVREPIATYKRWQAVGRQVVKGAKAKEFQAEATAFLTMNELEQLSEDHASKSRGYIQGWLRSDRPSDTSIRQVFLATGQILKAGRPEPASTVY